ADAERLDGVLDDVVGQDVDLAVRRDAEVDRLLEFVDRHPHHANVAKVDHLAGLYAADAVDLPPAEQAVDQPARIAAPPVVVAERQLVDDVSLYRMHHVADLPSL